ncbi:unnamed protein product [Cylicocyclus nassatus]|uniref:Uncharacterized protein n=1 Tax=Cylicocyclus nassatus TaxID=53992 RepID=A0AA36GXQ8_CYLNA|nr:unnamed protein product [Cylicocyclus nassatus]
MDFSRGISYDRIGNRAYGLMLDERLDRLAEDRQALLEMRQRRRAHQQQTIEPSEYLNFDTNVYDQERGDSPPTQMQAETIEDVQEDVQETLDYKNMPFNDRVLFYADYIQQCGLSNEGVKLLEQLMAVIFGTLPPIKYTSHVVPLNKNILQQYQHKKTYFCYSCGDMLHHWRDKCANAMCSLYRVAIKRAKGVQRVEVHVLDMIPQLSDLMMKEITNIIDFHRTLHENGGSPENDRSDMRREMWPLYLRVDNLPRSEADKYTNSILCGIVYSLGKPSLKMVESLFGRLESELNALKEEPIRIDVNGEIWSLEIRLHRGIADMQAQKALFGVPRWSSAQGCSKCYIMGQRTEGHRVWIQQEEDNSSLREPSSYRIDGQLGRNGIPNETPIMRIIRPCDFSGDALHVCSEGITKDRIREKSTNNSDFLSLRKKADNKHKAKFPLDISVNASVYIPKGSRVDRNLLEEEHKAIILQSGEEA